MCKLMQLVCKNEFCIEVINYFINYFILRNIIWSIYIE